MTRIFKPKEFKGVVYVNGKSVSVLNFKIGGDPYLTFNEERKLKEYIKHYNL